MKRIIAIGDIHGSRKWRDIVSKNSEYTVIFLGDYLDPYEKTYSCDKILDNLYDIIEFKQNNNERVFLLLGNHDLHYINNNAAICTRFDIRLIERAGTLFIDNLKLFQYAYQTDNIIFTHAGISHQWFIKDFKGNLSNNIAMQLNNPSKEQIKALYHVGESRGGDKDMQGGIFWADRSELTDPLHGFIQIVGHNQVNDITEYNGLNNNKIIFCDCLRNDKFYKRQI